MSRQAPVSSSGTSAPSRVVPASHYARLQHASGHVRPSVGYCVAGPQWQYVTNHPVYPSVQPYAQPYVVQHPIAHPHPHAEPYVVRQPIFQPHYHPSVMPPGCVIAPTYVKPTTAVHRPSQQGAHAPASSSSAPPEADNSGTKQKTTASPKVDDDPAVIKIMRRDVANPPPPVTKTRDAVPPQQGAEKEPLSVEGATKRSSTPSIISDDTGFDSASQKTSESGEDLGRNGDYLDIVHNLIEKIELDQETKKTRDNTGDNNTEGVPISIDNSYSNIQFSPNKAPSLLGRAFRLSGRCKPKKKSPVKRTKGFGAPPKTGESLPRNADVEAKMYEDDSWVEGEDNPVLAYQLTEPTFDFDRAREEAERRATERDVMDNDDAAPYHGKRWRRKSRQPNRPPMYKAWAAFKKPFKNRNQSQRGDGDGFYGNPNGNKHFAPFWQRGRTRRRHNTMGSQRHLADRLKLHPADGLVRGTYSVHPRGAHVDLNLQISLPHNNNELVSAEADLDESRVTIFDDDEAEPEVAPMINDNIPSTKRRSRRTTSEPRRRKNSYFRPNGPEGSRQPGHDDWEEWVHAGGMVSGKWGVVPRRERLRRTSSRNELWVDDTPSAYDVACSSARQDALRKRQVTGTRQRLGSNHA